MITEEGRNATAAALRVLLIVDATNTIGARRVSELDLGRLAYFTDAFAQLWGLRPLDRFRLKFGDPRTLVVRRALDRLVLSGLVVPSDVTVERDPRPYISASYIVDADRAGPVLDAARATEVGRREVQLVREVVFAAAGLLGGQLDEAVLLDAGYSDGRIGPNDLIDLESSTSGTSEVAKRFRPATVSNSTVEAELTHLYMAYLERAIVADD